MPLPNRQRQRSRPQPLIRHGIDRRWSVGLQRKSFALAACLVLITLPLRPQTQGPPILLLLLLLGLRADLSKISAAHFAPWIAWKLLFLGAEMRVACIASDHRDRHVSPITGVRAGVARAARPGMGKQSSAEFTRQPCRQPGSRRQ